MSTVVYKRKVCGCGDVTLKCLGSSPSSTKSLDPSKTLKETDYIVIVCISFVSGFVTNT